MEDLFNIDSASPIPQAPELSVSEISARIKALVESGFAFVRVKGEIFGAKRADSGHWYLTLKDDSAALSAVIWRGSASRLTVKPEDGMEVIATGKITTFAGKSSYQLIIDQMEIAGTGALLKLLEERKKQFAAEGLFDIARKKPLPYLPQTIGVVTSASGAVIRDIIHRIRDRFPSRILLIPTPVQGDGAAPKIAQAIRNFNRLDQISSYPLPDVLIIARGGGSLEDLWPFNEECVIRAAFSSNIPIISAVGHETDTMLIDYVADKRAPTPTGAAEMAVPVRAELQIKVNNLENRCQNSILRYFADKTDLMTALARGIPNLRQILQEAVQKFDDRSERLHTAFHNCLKDKSRQVELCRFKPLLVQKIIEKSTSDLNNLWLRLSSVSVGSVLKRGFVWVKDSQGRTVADLSSARATKEFELNFADGSLKTFAAAASTPIKKTSAKKEPENETLQISLFD